MIDLHTHTTASDGLCLPAELVNRAASAGVTILGVTDHDTVAALAEVAYRCRQAGIGFVPGIEITAIAGASDVHVLGYFLDPLSPILHEFLVGQREHRLERARTIGARLDDHGLPLDMEALVRPAIDDPSRVVGRPWLARAMVEAGYVADTIEAFDRWLGEGCPAYVPRFGAGPEEVVRLIHDAGGIASLAHPGLLKRDDFVGALAAAGMDALEAFHNDHTPEMTATYLASARRHGLAVSGGSDFHGDLHGAAEPGAVSLPPEEFERLRARAKSV